jgi:hypothetical protein
MEFRIDVDGRRRGSMHRRGRAIDPVVPTGTRLPHVPAGTPRADGVDAGARRSFGYFMPST